MERFGVVKTTKVAATSTAASDAVKDSDAADDAAGGGDELVAAPEDPYLDLKALAEIARNTWSVGSDSSGKIDSRDFATASWNATPDGRLPFLLVAAALQCDQDDAHQVRALTNVFRWVLQRSTDSRGDIKALVNTLTAAPTLHPQVVHAVGTAFKLKTTAVEATQYKGGDSMTAYRAPVVEAADLPHLALKGRKTQSRLFSKRLSVEEVAIALAPGSGQHSAKVTPDHEHYSKPFMQLLNKATPENCEIYHLVKVIQGRHCISGSMVLRALAYAVQLHTAGMDPEIMASYDKALYRLWAERGITDPDWLVSHLLPTDASPPLTAEALDAISAPFNGCWVRPMKSQEIGTIEEALEKQGTCGAVWAEWLLDGQRVQIHLTEHGSSAKVFESRGLCTKKLGNSVAEVASSILKGNLEGSDNAILEAVLMRPFKKAIDVTSKKKDEDECAETTAVDRESEPSGDAQIDVYGIVIFDALMLGGKPLIRQSLRARRKQLEAALRPTNRLLLAPGVELPEGPSGASAAKAELVRALGASPQGADDGEKAMNRAFGVVLKVLDGTASEYSPGLCVPYWQALSQQPAVKGAEADEAMFDVLTEAERAILPEQSEFHFCVISARRTQTKEGVQDILTVQRQFKDNGVDPTWYVDAQSLADYRALGLDAKVGGKLIPARNMALDDAAQLGKVCVQISDDIEKWLFVKEQGGWTKKHTLQEANAAGRICQRYQVSPIAAARFLLAKMRGSINWSPQLGGVLPHHNPGQAMAIEPCHYHSFILGDFFVVDKSPCRFDTRMSLKEDYDLTCAHLKTHGSVLRYNHLMVFAKHETNAGGACSIRDSQGQRERENIAILMEKYPGAFRENPKRPNQVILQWKGHVRWMKDNGGVKETSQKRPMETTSEVAKAKKQKRSVEAAEVASVARPLAKATQTTGDVEKIEAMPKRSFTKQMYQILRKAASVESSEAMPTPSIQEGPRTELPVTSTASIPAKTVDPKGTPKQKPRKRTTTSISSDAEELKATPKQKVRKTLRTEKVAKPSILPDGADEQKAAPEPTPAGIPFEKQAVAKSTSKPRTTLAKVSKSAAAKPRAKPAAKVPKSALEKLVTCSESTAVKFEPGAKTAISHKKSFQRYETYSKAATLKEALELGAAPQDLLYDCDRGFLTIIGDRRTSPVNETAATRVDKAVRSWQKLLDSLNESGNGMCVVEG